MAIKRFGAISLVAFLAASGAAFAEAPSLSKQALRGGTTTPLPAPPSSAKDWRSQDVFDAWAQGYLGQLTTITVVDDFNSGRTFSGNLGDGQKYLTHGGWTSKEAKMVAPWANLYQHDFGSGQAVALTSRGLNILNLSYGMMEDAGYQSSQISWSPQESSIIYYAQNGLAVTSKAAGNSRTSVDGVTPVATQDYLNLALIGGKTTLFVGALDRNGTSADKANLASYSNYAGENKIVQSQFLSVGVRGDLTGLYGTSFAAPIVSGYAAILGSKFRWAGATSITQQLLNTARTDTINNYDPKFHGRGEASLSRALAPRVIR